MSEFDRLLAAVESPDWAMEPLRKASARAALLAILRTQTGDPEVDHARADDALLAYIGDPEITAAFNAVDKWYA